MERLMEAGERASAEFMESCRGAVREVLFEEVCEAGCGQDCSEADGNASLLTGYTDNYIKVYAKGTSGDLNSIKRVKLLEKYKDGMKGEIE